MPKRRWWVFLWDVFKTSCVSFGGPEAHYAVFIRKLAREKAYVKEQEIKEWLGVFSLVPGPSSTQTIMAIGYAYGGPLLAFLTWIVWAFPAMVILSILAYFYPLISTNPQWRDGLRYLPVLAVAFLGYAAILMVANVFKDKESPLIFGVVFLFAYFFQSLSFWVLPGLLIATGIFIVGKHRNLWLHEVEKKPIRLSFYPIVIFLILTLSVEGFRFILSDSLSLTWVSFYRFGYSIIGGGQLVVPYMIQSLVGTQTGIPLDVFLSGYSIDQAIPGPLFSFASFVGAYLNSSSIVASLSSGIISGFMIFLPGILGVYIIFPIWKQLKDRLFFQYFLKGVVIAVSALIALTAITQTVTIPLFLDVYLVYVVTLFLLLNKKINPLVLVVGVVVIGFIV